MENNQPKVIEFSKCPNCGSTKRLAETLAEEVKERKLIKPEAENYVHIIRGIVADQSRAAALPIGIKVPAYLLHTDVCLDCGTYYAVKIVIGEAQLGIMPKPPTSQQGMHFG